MKKNTLSTYQILPMLGLLVIPTALLGAGVGSGCSLNPVNIVMGILGGLALFLYGMELMSDGLKQAAGEKMKLVLAALSKNRFLGVLTGTITTAIIQSSSVTTVLLVGFAIPAWANRVNDVPPDEEATVVHVIAKQFEWHSHYAGADGRFGRRDISEITPTNAIGLDRSVGSGIGERDSIVQILDCHDRSERAKRFLNHHA